MKSVAELRKLEQVTLAYMLNNIDYYYQNAEIIDQGIFLHNDICKKVFHAFKEISGEGLSPDVVVVSERSGIDLLTITEVFTAINYQYDFRSSLQALVVNKIETQFLSMVNALQSGLHNNVDIHTLIGNVKRFIDQFDASKITRLEPIKTHYQALKEKVAARQLKQNIGIPTGLSKWDKHTGGLTPSDLIVIAAETSQGKTSLALSMAFNSATRFDAVVAIFSYEMSAEQLTARFVAIESGVSGKSIMYSKLEGYELDKINNVTKVPNAQIYIDDCKSVSIDYLVAGIRSAYMRYGAQIIMIDYIQLVKDPEKRNEETEIASNTRKLKNLAKELNITIIILSQLSRDRNSPRPSLSRLRGSGQIEEAADIVALIWRPETAGINVYNDAPIQNTENTAEIIFAKGRNIGTGRMWLNYNPQLNYYYDCEY